MSWSTQYEGKASPERRFSDKEQSALGRWQERYEEITTGQVKRKLKYSPELASQLEKINPDDERAIAALAEKLGEDEAILAAIAFSLRSNLGTLN